MNGLERSDGTHAGRRIEVGGTVQGVGFRPWVYRVARACGVTGLVRNGVHGVTIEAFGSRDALARFEARLAGSPPPAAAIRSLRSIAIPYEPVAQFAIAASDTRGDRRVSIPPDLATCAECAAEIFTADNRRYRYPFTNCTNCGPRFTIARAVPYDRATTTMARFVLCDACRREYESPDDRRFHAEPNACPRCGPRLSVVRADATPVDAGDPIEMVAAALRAGSIVAIKGIGGFHLACDATSSDATARLRERKRRDEKPFAVMVRDLAAAQRLAEVGAAERALLESVERPIVLVTARADAGVSPLVAPHNPLLGLLLPYSPLHHLLLAAVDRPLVMTSGNLSDEPLAWRNEEALQRLAGIADLCLLHDRDIVAPCDDSVARVIAGRPVLVRRARGYVPRPLPLGTAVERPVLACGALLKNTFCIASADSAYLGPHIGDLEHLETYRAYEAAIERMERFLDVRVEVVAHDLHPDYLSTRYALARPERLRVGVQHHHAHVASAMAEHRLTGPVIGVAYDGTGYGLDGTAWGGEVLLATYGSFERIATFKPIPLAGGDAAIREPWRIALALVDDAFGDDAPLERLSIFRGLPRHTVAAVRRMLPEAAVSPLASGIGRYFDGFGALGLSHSHAAYEGQVAFDWNMAADPAVTDAYPYALSTDVRPWTVDLSGAVRQAVIAILDGVPPGAISAMFHNTIARATADIVRHATLEIDRLPVVLTGGCFQNARLTESILAMLPRDTRVFTHGAVPPGDGGLALGQALVADAVVRRNT